jgi:pimeloyl-ACP methyl ester carboxylesterase
MSDPSHRTVHANGIDLHLVEQGVGPLVVLCHGFPEGWYSWRHQLPVLADAGYHAVALDQRGYGGSDAPPDVGDYDILHLTGDLTALLDELGEERAVFVGHDWGAIVVWNLAVLAPERVRAVAGLSVPFVPRAPMPPLQLLQAVSGDRFLYILYFQRVGRPEEELGRDPRATLRRVLWGVSGDAPPGSIKRMPVDGTGWLDIFPDPPEKLPGWLTEQDLDIAVEAFARSGFRGPLNWYRNMDRNWELTEHVAQAKVEVPALFVAGTRDSILKLTPPAIMDGWLGDLRRSLLIEGAGHWIQQERPREVNDALLGFLREV